MRKIARVLMFVPMCFLIFLTSNFSVSGFSDVTTVQADNGIYTTLDTYSLSPPMPSEDARPRWFGGIERALEEDLDLSVEEFAVVTKIPNRSFRTFYPGASIKIHATESVTIGACSIGFFTRNEFRNYAITAGHCNPGENVTKVELPFLTNAYHTDSKFHYNANDDVGIVGVRSSTGGDTEFDYKNAAFLSNDRRIILDRIADPIPGMPICTNGVTSGWRCGVVLQVDNDLNKFTSNLCTYPGDSGGAIISGNSIVGIATQSFIRNDENVCSYNPSKYSIANTQDPATNAVKASYAIKRMEELTGYNLDLK